MRKRSKYERRYLERIGKLVGEAPAVSDAIDQPDQVEAAHRDDREKHPGRPPVPNATAPGVEQPATEVPSVAPPVNVASVTSLTFTSSNIQSAEINVESGIVTVTFNNGKAYRYANFTVALMTEWSAAKSAGSWFHQRVRMRPSAHPVIDDTEQAAETAQSGEA